MSRVLLGFLLAGVLFSCQDSENAPNNFSGNEVVYTLQSGSEFNVYGTATVKERNDGKAEVVVVLTGTSGSGQHPVHLHLGDIGQPDADVAALLNPVSAGSGKSSTTLTVLANEESITYQDLIALNACIKVHLSAIGSGQDIVLAGGNIGSAVTQNSGRTVGLAVCKSE